MRRRMQIIFQDPYGSLDPRMTVGSTIAEPIETHDLASGDAKRERIADLLRLVGLDPTYVVALPARVLRRPAAAHRHRPGPRRGARVHRLRRAHLGARRVDPGPGPQPADRPAPAAGPDLPVHRPRPLGGQAHQRPGRGDVPRQDRRDRTAATRSTRARPPVHAGAALGGAGPGPGRRAQAPPGDPQGRRAQPREPAVGLPLPHPLLALRAPGTAGDVPHGRPAAQGPRGRPVGRLPLRRRGAQDRRRHRPPARRAGPARHAGLGARVPARGRPRPSRSSRPRRSTRACSGSPGSVEETPATEMPEGFGYTTILTESPEKREDEAR